jgi:hypothetical protein
MDALKTTKKMYGSKPKIVGNIWKTQLRLLEDAENDSRRLEMLRWEQRQAIGLMTISGKDGQGSRRKVIRPHCVKFYNSNFKSLYSQR